MRERAESPLRPEIPKISRRDRVVARRNAVWRRGHGVNHVVMLLHLPAEPSQACSNSPQRNLTIESLSLLSLHSLFHGRSIGRWTVHLSSTPVVLAPGGIQLTVQNYAVKLLSRHSPTRVCLFIHEPRCAIILHHHHEGIQANRGTSPAPNMPLIRITLTCICRCLARSRSNSRES